MYSCHDYFGGWAVALDVAHTLDRSLIQERCNERREELQRRSFDDTTVQGDGKVIAAFVCTLLDQT
jgi:hypothetical protein